MKVFCKWFAIPLLIAVIASILYVIDALVAGIFVEGASFMWVAFAIWTIFYGVTIKDRIKGFIGVMVGFLAAIVMMLITNSFALNIGTISISCLIGVFVVNIVVMFMDKADKVWLNSVSGVFAGIFLTFSGFGVGLSPVVSISDSLLMAGILAVYTILGLICGFFSIWVSAKIKNRIEK